MFWFSDIIFKRQEVNDRHREIQLADNLIHKGLVSRIPSGTIKIKSIYIDAILN